MRRQLFITIFTVINNKLLYQIETLSNIILSVGEIIVQKQRWTARDWLRVRAMTTAEFSRLLDVVA